MSRTIPIGKVGITPKGEWDSETIYNNLDIVSYNNNSFISNQNNIPINTAPHNKEYWTQLTNLDGAKIIFMPIVTDTGNNGRASDCIVFISKTGKVLMIDAGKDHSYDLIVNELEKNNITHIDYFILTHYHTDHSDNLYKSPTGKQNFINKYMDSTTIAYLPLTGRAMGFAWGCDNNGNGKSYLTSTSGNQMKIKNYISTNVDIQGNPIVTNVLPEGWAWSREIEENIISTLKNKQVTILPEEIELTEQTTPSSLEAQTYSLILDNDIIAPMINNEVNSDDLKEIADLEFDGIKVQFINTRKKDIKYYIYGAIYGSTGKNINLNNTSIVNYITIGETVILTTGDLEAISEEYTCGDVTNIDQISSQYISDDNIKSSYLELIKRINKPCDILKVPHHMAESIVYQDFYLRTHPKTAIVTTTWYFAQRSSVTSGSARWLNYINTPVYVIGSEPITVGINDNTNTIFTKNLPFYSADAKSGSDYILQIYVDNSKTQDYVDGSKEYPYESLQSAIGAVKNYTGLAVDIILRDNYIDNNFIWIDSMKTIINISPENTNSLLPHSLYAVRVNNSTVNFNNINFTQRISNYPLSFTDAKGSITSCNFTAMGGYNSDGSDQKGERGIYVQNSQIRVINCNISNKQNCIRNVNSIIYIQNLSGTNNNYPLENGAGGINYITLNENFQAVYREQTKNDSANMTAITLGDVKVIDDYPTTFTFPAGARFSSTFRSTNYIDFLVPVSINVRQSNKLALNFPVGNEDLQDYLMNCVRYITSDGTVQFATISSLTILSSGCGNGIVTIRAGYNHQSNQDLLSSPGIWLQFPAANSTYATITYTP